MRSMQGGDIVSNTATGSSRTHTLKSAVTQAKSCLEASASILRSARFVLWCWRKAARWASLRIAFEVSVCVAATRRKLMNDAII